MSEPVLYACAPKPELRWFHCRLIPLMAAIAVFGSIAVKIQRAKQQRDAVAAVMAMHGSVVYDWECVPKPHSDDERTECGEPPGPPWLRDLMGTDFFSAVNHVTLRGPDVTDVGVERLRDLVRLRSMHLESTKVTADCVWKLRVALPNCRIDKE
jgi:hypothetical protein